MFQPFASLAHFVGKSLSVFGDVFKDNFVEQHRYGI
jgi:hypothetical protein